MNSTERNYLRVIHKRILFLEQRILDNGGSHDVQEVTALRWLLKKAALPVPSVQ